MDRHYANSHDEQLSVQRPEGGNAAGFLVEG